MKTKQEATVRLASASDENDKGSRKTTGESSSTSMKSTTITASSLKKWCQSMRWCEVNNTSEQWTTIKYLWRSTVFNYQRREPQSTQIHTALDPIKRSWRETKLIKCWRHCCRACYDRMGVADRLCAKNGWKFAFLCWLSQTKCCHNTG